MTLKAGSSDNIKRQTDFRFEACFAAIEALPYDLFSADMKRSGLGEARENDLRAEVVWSIC